MLDWNTCPGEPLRVTESEIAEDLRDMTSRPGETAAAHTSTMRWSAASALAHYRAIFRPGYAAAAGWQRRIERLPNHHPGDATRNGPRRAAAIAATAAFAAATSIATPFAATTAPAVAAAAFAAAAFAAAAFAAAAFAAFAATAAAATAAAAAVSAASVFTAATTTAADHTLIVVCATDYR